ncbi:hypothetical protein [Asanoa sp. NPDC050611]|uniref:hypothetical protein n=1 Tax=Asanoa sp. NPDC050611 TaxID=3157098 RepID=UPI0033F2E914
MSCAIGDFAAQCGRDDLALVYLSCHAVLDTRRRLWFAAADTVKSRGRGGEDRRGGSCAVRRDPPRG